MAFRLRNKNIPSALKQTNQEVTVNADGSGGTVDVDKIKWNYEGGDENTANTRWGYKTVENKMSDEEWNALSKEEQDKLNNAYKVVQNRDDWDKSEHWSVQRDHIYKDHGGSMLNFLLRKVRKKFGDSWRAKTWKEDFGGMNNPQLQDWFKGAFNDSESEHDFIEWAQTNAPYVLERGRGRANVHSKKSSGKGSWKS